MDDEQKQQFENRQENEEPLTPIIKRLKAQDPVTYQPTPKAAQEKGRASKLRTPKKRASIEAARMSPRLRSERKEKRVIHPLKQQI